MQEPVGFIKDYRKELTSDIWLMPPLYHRVWQYLKYKVNFYDNEIPLKDGSKMLIKKGQYLTSVRGIAQGVGWYEGRKWKEPNPKTISSILDWFEKQQMITIERGKGNRQYTLITLINWDLYQHQDFEGNSKYTVDGEGRKQSADIKKESKECIKKEKKELYIPDAVQNIDIDFLPLINTLNITCKGAFQLEQLQSYLGLMDEALIQEALKRSENKNIPYAIAILEGWKGNGCFSIKDLHRENDRMNNNPPLPRQRTAADEIRELRKQKKEDPEERSGSYYDQYPGLVIEVPK